ncbi:prenyltransferase [bacterium]|nr:prenyltransferase [bacterium]
MNKFLENIKFWYNNSRPYTIPITALSWLVIFIYSLKQGGNAIYGIAAYIGIALVHLATNLSDDYLDYLRLNHNGEFINNEKANKCKYLKDGKATIKDLRNVIIILLAIAGVMGGILFFLSGWKVILFALAVLPIALFYSKLSSNGLGDFAVILAYGPLMYEGVYYVMRGELSLDVLYLSFACAMYVNSILYAHMLMDYDSDTASNKISLCTRLGSKQNALYGLMFFYFTGYIMMGILALKSSNMFYFLTFLTIPLIFDLYNSLKLYNENPNLIPKARPWHYPLDNWKDLQHSETATFFFRFFYARNISTYFMLLTCIAIILG